MKAAVYCLLSFSVDTIPMKDDVKVSLTQSSGTEAG